MDGERLIRFEISVTKVIKDNKKLIENEVKSLQNCWSSCLSLVLVSIAHGKLHPASSCHPHAGKGHIAARNSENLDIYRLVCLAG